MITNRNLGCLMEAYRVSHKEFHNIRDWEDEQHERVSDAYIEVQKEIELLQKENAKMREVLVEISSESMDTIAELEKENATDKARLNFAAEIIKEAREVNKFQNGEWDEWNVLADDWLSTQKTPVKQPESDFFAHAKETMGEERYIKSLEKGMQRVNDLEKSFPAWVDRTLERKNKQIEKLRGALEFYADGEHYTKEGIAFRINQVGEDEFEQEQDFGSTAGHVLRELFPNGKEGEG